MAIYDPETDRAVFIRQLGDMKSGSTSAWRSAWFRVTVGRLGRALEDVQPDRSTLALSTRAGVVLIASVLLSACSGSTSPTSPTPTTAVTATPVAQPAPPVLAPAASLVSLESIAVTSCINGLCTFEVLVNNTGDACAANISGETTVASAQGVEVARVRWIMPSATVLRPSEHTFFVAEGMPQVVLNHLDGRVRTTFVFESRSC